MESNLPPIDELTDEALMKYIEKFLDINEFRQISNGKALLSCLSQHPSHPKIKSIVRKVLGLFHTDSPTGKVCSLQFIKEAMETNSWIVVDAVQKSLLPKVAEVVEYRAHIKSIQRGSSYFIRQFDKEATDEDIVNLIKISTTFFRMIHECIYVWGAIYFPGSAYDKMRIKLQKRFQFPKYPEDFKFFNQQKINNFQSNCQDVIDKMAECIEELKSQSSVEKKRESSLRASRLSEKIHKEDRSQSTDPAKASLHPKQTAKQLTSKQNKSAYEKQIPHQPVVGNKKRQVQISKKEQKSDIIENRSHTLRKKNSFSELEETQQMQSSKDSSPEAKLQKPSNSSKSLSIKPSLRAERFKTIVQDQESEGGRYSLPESDITSEFSRKQHDSAEGHNLSQRSECQSKKKDTLKLKKYTSKQIVNQTQKYPVSLNEPNKLRNTQYKLPVGQEKYKQYLTNDLKKQQMNIKQIYQPIEQIKEKGSFKGLIRQATRTQIANMPPTKKANKRRKKYDSQEQQPSKQALEQHSKTRENQKQTFRSLEQNRQIHHQFPQQSAKTIYEIQRQQKQVIEQEQAIYPPQSYAPPKQIKSLKSNHPISSNGVSVRVPKPKKIKGTNSSKSIFQQNQTYQEASIKSIGVVQQHKIAQGKNPYPTPKSLQSQPNVQQSTHPVLTSKQNSMESGKSKEDDFIKKTNNQLRRQDIPSLAQIINSQEIIPQRIQKSDGNPHQGYSKRPSSKIQNKIKTIHENKTSDYFAAHPIECQYPQTPERDKKNIAHRLQLQSLYPQDPNTVNQPFLNSSPKGDKKQLKQTTLSNSRFKKYSQISLTISPSPDKLSQVGSRVIAAADQELKSVLQEQLKEQFDQLKSALLSLHKESINYNLQQQISTLSETKPKQAVECGIQTKPRFKSKSKFQKKKVFLEQIIEAETQPINQPNISTKQKDPKEDIISKQLVSKQVEIKSSAQLKGSSLKRNKDASQVGQFAPNTLLYALYRKKSMNR